MTRRRPNGTSGPGRTVRSVEKKIPFFDRPTIVAAKHDSVDLLDVVLADVGLNQVTGNGVKIETIRITQPVSVDLRHLAWSLERVARWDSILSVRADRVRTGWVEGRVERVEAQHFAEWGTQILRIAARLDMTGADIIGISAVAQSEVRVAIGAKGDCATVVIPRVFAERNDRAA